jgi:hypothetical protein
MDGAKGLYLTTQNACNLRRKMLVPDGAKNQFLLFLLPDFQFLKAKFR